MNNSLPPHRDAALPLKAILLLLAGCAVLLSPMLAFRMGADQGLQAFVAAELLQGNLPYVDNWDHQFPGGWVLHALEIFLFGKSVLAFRIFDLFFQLGSAYLIFRITLKFAVCQLPFSLLSCFV